MNTTDIGVTHPRVRIAIVQGAQTAAEAANAVDAVEAEDVLRISTIKREGQPPLVVVMGKQGCIDRVEADRVVVNLATDKSKAE
jgi:3-dehydroquinate dehydratase